MKAKKLFPDLSFKRLWDKIKDLEEKVEQGGSGSDSDSNEPKYKEQSGIVSQFTTTPHDGADDMYIDFPEVFDTVPTDFVCVDVEQSNMFTFTVKELTRSYAIVTVKSSLSYNSINDFQWKAVAYSGDQNENLNKKYDYSKKEAITTLYDVDGTYTVQKQGKVILYFAGNLNVVGSYLVRFNEMLIGGRGYAPSDRFIWGVELNVQEGDVLKVQDVVNTYAIDNFFIPYE